VWKAPPRRLHRRTLCRGLAARLPDLALGGSRCAPARRPRLGRGGRAGCDRRREVEWAGDVHPTTTFGTTTFGTTTTGSNVTWPPNKDGFTVVLKSVPTSNGRSQAEAAADKARTNGLSQVGILNSSDFSSLNPGYYVTFTGIYDTESQANAALPNARSKGFPTAYVREVSN